MGTHIGVSCASASSSRAVPDGSEARPIQSPLRVIIVESHEIARRGVQDMARGISFVTSVRAVGSAAAAGELLADEPAEVIITSDAEEGDVKSLARLLPEGTALLLLLHSADGTSLTQAARLPVNGFLIEPDLTSESLADALTEIGAGQTPIPRALADHLLAVARDGRTSSAIQLTAREFQVLRLMVEGLSNKDIGDGLGISPHGAKRHVANILAKLNCTNRTLAVARALSDDLVRSRLA